MSRLYKQFDHWYLVWAGYNGGPGRVSRGIKKYGTRDSWELEAHNAFPAETDNYVPKIVAAAIIGKYRERYGFTDIKYQEPLDYKTVTIDGNVGVMYSPDAQESAAVSLKPTIHTSYNMHYPQHPQSNEYTSPQTSRKAFSIRILKSRSQSALLM